MPGERSAREKRKAEARAAAEASSAERRARKLFRRCLLRDDESRQLEGEVNSDEKLVISSAANAEADDSEGDIEALRKRFPEIWSQCVQARVGSIERKQRAIQKERVYIDDPAVLDEKLSKVADLILQEGQFTLHTGAGISTSAGIPDYRGPNGLWTTSKRKPVKLPLLGEARPTMAHRICKELLSAGYISRIITQNVDGLHWRSGVPLDRITELHGSAYREKCTKCGALFLRSFEVNPGKYSKRMKTGRTCDYLCGGQLVDSIIHFGQKLNAKDLHTAETGRNLERQVATRQSNLAIVVGSSLRVPPACKIPFLAQNVVIVSIQWTPKDSKAFLKINSTADDFFLLLQKKIGCRLDSHVFDDPVHKNESVSTLRASPGKSLDDLGIGDALSTDTIPHKRHKGL